MIFCGPTITHNFQNIWQLLAIIQDPRYSRWCIRGHLRFRNMLKIYITEHNTSGNPSIGGSHFWITQEYQMSTWFRSMCDFQDYFNGKYTACCPHAGNRCTHVIITRCHVQLHGFLHAGLALSAVRNNETTQIYKGVLPFIMIQLFVLMLVVAYPSFVL